MNRRQFFRNAVAVSATPLAVNGAAVPSSAPALGADRKAWTAMLLRVVEPVFSHLAGGRLKADMPVEARAGHEGSRKRVTHLEALGRALCGAAPWLAVSGLSGDEERQRARLAELVRRALSNAVDPASPDVLAFTAAAQNLVDAAFLAQGLARAKAELWDKLDDTTKQRIIAALQSTRKFKPGRNNWLLFAATIEAFLASVGASWLPEPIETAITAHEEWYKGDGAYGDGAEFHWDYYNSYVIQPMLLAVLELISPIDSRWQKHHDPMVARARRYAAVQARLVAQDGTYPPLGRSITYRCGAFQVLAMMALRRQLPDGLSPAQARGVLSAVIHRTLGAEGTFDEKGWLRIGLSGHQPSLGETYISTGSLYLCSAAFLPLGLTADDEFWTGPAAAWPAREIWAGADLPGDHALHG